MKVWVNGCFDVLHYGHFQILQYASTFGDVVVGIDSDRRVKELKGDDRPYHNELQRKQNLKLIKGVLKVIIFDTEEELMQSIANENPDIMVIGSDYKDKRIIGREFVREVKFFDRIKDLSTTDILFNWIG